jgi:hypothetical protein
LKIEHRLGTDLQSNSHLKKRLYLIVKHKGEKLVRLSEHKVKENRHHYQGPKYQVQKQQSLSGNYRNKSIFISSIMRTPKMSNPWPRIYIYVRSTYLYIINKIIRKNAIGLYQTIYI